MTDPADHIARLYAQAEAETAKAMESLVASPGFSSP